MKSKSCELCVCMHVCKFTQLGEKHPESLALSLLCISDSFLAFGIGLSFTDALGLDLLLVSSRADQNDL